MQKQPVGTYSTRPLHTLQKGLPGRGSRNACASSLSPRQQLLLAAKTSHLVSSADWLVSSKQRRRSLLVVLGTLLALLPSGVLAANVCGTSSWTWPGASCQAYLCAGNVVSAGARPPPLLASSGAPFSYPFAALGQSGTCNVDGSVCVGDTTLALVSSNGSAVVYNDDFCGACSFFTFNATLAGWCALLGQVPTPPVCDNRATSACRPT